MHEQIDAARLIRQARESVLQGRKKLRAACSFVSGASADIRVPCHAAWNPLLLACMAAEGTHELELDGIRECASCPVRHGAKMVAETEQDYAVLSKSMRTRLTLNHDTERQASSPQEKKQPEPERRAFFRKLIPSLAQGAAMTAAQIGEAMRQDEVTFEGDPALPLMLQLFLKALPRLQPNFTPLPRLASVPLGAVQADDRCTACGRCIDQCPTKALSLKPFGSNQLLEFRPDACIGCDHCADICPEQAITPLPSLSLPPVAARHSRPLVMVTTHTPKKHTAVSD